MQVEDKYFPQDKNYLLKTVQAFSEDSLLCQWIEKILNAYSLHHNPMGLEDDFIIELREKIRSSKKLLSDCYDILAAIYRHDYGNNQLEFQWDGRTHMEVYDADWKAMYHQWTQQLSTLKEIQRPVIRYAVSGELVNTDFLRQSMRRGVLNYFNIKLRAQTLYRLSA